MLLQRRKSRQHQGLVLTLSRVRNVYPDDFHRVSFLLPAVFPVSTAVATTTVTQRPGRIARRRSDALRIFFPPILFFPSLRTAIFVRQTDGIL